MDDFTLGPPAINERDTMESRGSLLNSVMKSRGCLTNGVKSFVRKTKRLCRRVQFQLSASVESQRSSGFKKKVWLNTLRSRLKAMRSKRESLVSRLSDMKLVKSTLPDGSREYTACCDDCDDVMMKIKQMDSKLETQERKIASVKDGLDALEVCKHVKCKGKLVVKNHKLVCNVCGEVQGNAESMQQSTFDQNQHCEKVTKKVLKAKTYVTFKCAKTLENNIEQYVSRHGAGKLWSLRNMPEIYKFIDKFYKLCEEKNEKDIFATNGERDGRDLRQRIVLSALAFISFWKTNPSMYGKKECQQLIDMQKPVYSGLAQAISSMVVASNMANYEAKTIVNKIRTSELLWEAVALDEENGISINDETASVEVSTICHPRVSSTLDITTKIVITGDLVKTKGTKPKYGDLGVCDTGLVYIPHTDELFDATKQREAKLLFLKNLIKSMQRQHTIDDVAHDISCEIDERQQEEERKHIEKQRVMNLKEELQHQLESMEADEEHTKYEHIELAFGDILVYLRVQVLHGVIQHAYVTFVPQNFKLMESKAPLVSFYHNNDKFFVGKTKLKRFTFEDMKTAEEVKISCEDGSVVNGWVVETPDIYSIDRRQRALLYKNKDGKLILGTKELTESNEYVVLECEERRMNFTCELSYELGGASPLGPIFGRHLPLPEPDMHIKAFLNTMEMFFKETYTGLHSKMFKDFITTKKVSWITQQVTPATDYTSLQKLKSKIAKIRKYKTDFGDAVHDVPSRREQEEILKDQNWLCAKDTCRLNLFTYGINFYKESVVQKHGDDSEDDDSEDDDMQATSVCVAVCDTCFNCYHDLSLSEAKVLRQAMKTPGSGLCTDVYRRPKKTCDVTTETLKWKSVKEFCQLYAQHCGSNAVQERLHVVVPLLIKHIGHLEIAEHAQLYFNLFVLWAKDTQTRSKFVRWLKHNANKDEWAAEINKVENGEPLQPLAHKFCSSLLKPYFRKIYSHNDWINEMNDSVIPDIALSLKHWTNNIGGRTAQEEAVPQADSQADSQAASQPSNEHPSDKKMMLTFGDPTRKNTVEHCGKCQKRTVFIQHEHFHSENLKRFSFCHRCGEEHEVSNKEKEIYVERNCEETDDAYMKRVGDKVAMWQQNGYDVTILKKKPLEDVSNTKPVEIDNLDFSGSVVVDNDFSHLKRIRRMQLHDGFEVEKAQAKKKRKKWRTQYMSHQRRKKAKKDKADREKAESEQRRKMYEEEVARMAAAYSVAMATPPVYIQAQTVGDLFMQMNQPE